MTTRIPLSAPCPRCGPVPRIVAHLVSEHGFRLARAKGIAVRILNRERLSAGDCHRLGIPPQSVKLKGAMSQARLERDAVPAGLPDDRQLDAAVAAIFGGRS